MRRVTTRRTRALKMAASGPRFPGGGGGGGTIKQTTDSDFQATVQHIS